MTRRLIVFDVDGTLVDSQAHILASMADAFAAVNRPMPDRATALSVVGLSLPLALRRLAADAAEDEALAMVEAYKAAFQRIRLSGAAASPLYPGARAVLDALRAEVSAVLGLATGKSRRGLDHLVGLHGLAPYFRTMQVADDHPSKPHPSMLHAALRETGLTADAGVMVGDTEYDIDMGRAAGFRTVGVAWGYHGRERLAAADIVIDGWGDFLPALAAFRAPA